MWYRGDRDTPGLDLRQLEEEIRNSDRRIAILEGPTRCGKTYFLNHLAADGVRIVPGYRFQEDLIESVKTTAVIDEALARTDALYNDCRILCIEDVDLLLAGRETTQKLTADLFLRIARTRRIILTGIGIETRCAPLLTRLGEEAYDRYRFGEEEEKA